MSENIGNQEMLINQLRKRQLKSIQLENFVDWYTANILCFWLKIYACSIKQYVKNAKSFFLLLEEIKCYSKAKRKSSHVDSSLIFNVKSSDERIFLLLTTLNIFTVLWIYLPLFDYSILMSYKYHVYLITMS